MSEKIDFNKVSKNVIMNNQKGYNKTIIETCNKIMDITFKGYSTDGKIIFSEIEKKYTSILKAIGLVEGEIPNIIITSLGSDFCKKGGLIKLEDIEKYI